MFTYDDFLKKLGESDFNLSDADMALAKSNPDAGMGIIQYITNYRNATTQEAKDAAHSGAEGLRSTIGNYSGGTSGDQYLANLTETPSSFDMSALTDYKSPYATQISDALNKLTSAGDYKSPYASQIQDVLNGNYDITKNGEYQSLAKANAREASRSAADAMGTSAALTGGMASSYATNAAAQSADYYNSQTADAVPDILNNYLTQLQTQDSSEYQRFIDKIGLTKDEIETLQSLDADNYDKVKTAIEDAYQQWTDQSTYNADRADAATSAKQNEASLAADDKSQKLSVLASLYDSTGDSSYLKQLLALLNS